jgi:polysaccharide pyruvyl transferase WcaK-like protein
MTAMAAAGAPITLDHPLIRSDRVRFFLDPTTWFEHLAQYDFSFGTRIHGNIAALLAGTPALLLAHDSRTLELAEYHEIPHRTITSIEDDADADHAVRRVRLEPAEQGAPGSLGLLCRFPAGPSPDACL